MGGGQLMNTRNIVPILITLSIVICLCCPTADAGVILGIRGGFHMPQGWADAHDVIYDSSGSLAFGFEAGYTFNFPLEIALGVDFMSEDGTRVWPDGQGGWESDDTSVSYDMMPVTLVARWRFRREKTFSPYAGAGLGYVTFEESGEDSKDGTGFVLQGGGDFYLAKRVKLYGEVEYTSFPDVIGNAGTSHYFGEDDVGGLSVRLGVRFTF
jgi:opacity protein-like surface antigen